jgi:predicted DNA-binding transcriptional regulator AlpA
VPEHEAAVLQVRAIAPGSIPAGASYEQAMKLLGELAALHASLAAVPISVPPERTPSGSMPVEDRLLTPSELAERMNVTIRWVYRHANDWPFTRRLSRRMLRFSEAGVARFLAQKRLT